MCHGDVNTALNLVGSEAEVNAKDVAKQVLLEVVQGYPRASLTKNLCESKKRYLIGKEQIRNLKLPKVNSVTNLQL